jgi:hypothetical protein
MRYQSAVAASVTAPVVMSSLILLPGLLRQLARRSKLAILTFDSSHCDNSLLPIKDPDDLARVVIGGIEGGKFWHDEMTMPPPAIDIAAIEADVIDRILRMRNNHPEIAAILLECAAFPLIAQGIRRITGLPVYDITDLCRMTLGSVSHGRSPQGS